MKQRTIRVRAKAGVLVAVPRQRAGHGQPAMYVGRMVDATAFATGETDADALYPPTDGQEFTADRFDVFSEVQRAVRGGDLEAADKATADFCGVKFVGAAQPEAPTRADKRNN